MMKIVALFVVTLIVGCQQDRYVNDVRLTDRDSTLLLESPRIVGVLFKENYLLTQYGRPFASVATAMGIGLTDSLEFRQANAQEVLQFEEDFYTRDFQAKLDSFVAVRGPVPYKKYEERLPFFFKMRRQYVGLQAPSGHKYVFVNFLEDLQCPTTNQSEAEREDALGECEWKGVPQVLDDSWEQFRLLYDLDHGEIIDYFWP